MLEALEKGWRVEDGDRGVMWSYKKAFTFVLLIYIVLSGGLLIALKMSMLIDLGLFCILTLVLPFFYVVISLISAYRENDEFSSSRSRNLLFALIMVAILVVDIAMAFKFVEVSDPIEDVVDRQNFDDTDVDEFQTGLLAMFSVCCFEGDNETAPDLTCDTLNDTQPCYTDEELFSDKVEDVGGENSRRCKIIRGKGAKFFDSCDKDLEDFVHSLAARAKDMIRAIAYLYVVIGCILLVTDLSLLLYFSSESRTDDLYS